jgi:diadenosine tetraphosphatase ApaH/serine/threonine PP2A family protein phosphatase
MPPNRIPDHLALVSDIHANLEALEAVFADIDRRPIKEVWCLGDIVGYGPSPVECLKATRDRSAFTLMGNHDYAVLHGPLSFNFAATTAIECHVKLLTAWSRNAPWDAMVYLASLPLSLKLAGTTFVHSSPRDPLWEYLFVGKAYEDPGQLEGVYDFIERVCFCGHTHHPGAVIRADDNRYISLPARGREYPLTLPVSLKAYVNIGSVGQPRDGDTRACYVELRGNHAIFHRVEYDFRKTMAKLSKLPIHPRCALRLAQGR